MIIVLRFSWTADTCPLGFAIWCGDFLMIVVLELPYRVQDGPSAKNDHRLCEGF